MSEPHIHDKCVTRKQDATGGMQVGPMAEWIKCPDCLAQAESRRLDREAMRKARETLSAAMPDLNGFVYIAAREALALLDARLKEQI